MPFGMDFLYTSPTHNAYEQKERNTMKKALSVLMAMTMTAAVLTGCAKSTPEQTTAASSANATTEVTTTAAQITTEPTTQEANTDTEGDSYTLKVGSLKGPTSMGLVELMDKAEKGNAKGSYEFSMVTAPDELIGKMANKELDAALVPANMASIIYNKTKHGVSVIDINTLGVLYAVSADDSIKTTKDLKGKTIYLPGKGATPDYALQHLLKANGLTTDDVTLEYKSEPTEVAAILKEKPEAVGLLPQPFVTVAMAQNDSLKMVLDLTKEWDAVAGENGGSLVTGVTICRTDLLNDHKAAIDTFMEEHKESADYANVSVRETAKLVVAAGIIAKAPIAEKALPYCSISYIDGNDMKTMLSGYLTTLNEMEPSTIGGTLPEDDFYYLP
jgi:NitT/TauT family transport system substrate-binding protein